MTEKIAKMKPFRRPYLCRCPNGCEKELGGGSLRSGNAAGCRCRAPEGILAEFAERHPNLTGQTFGELKVLGIVGPFRRNRFASKEVLRVTEKVAYLKCLCSCGKEVEIVGKRVTDGITRSCGHLASTRLSYAHGGGQFNRERTLPAEVTARRLVLTSYRYGAKRRKIVYGLTGEETWDLVHQDCHYCGAIPGRVITCAGGSYSVGGIDRVDSSRGYFPDNVVPCCTVCNIAKLDFSEEEFLAWAVQVQGFRDQSRLTYALAPAAWHSSADPAKHFPLGYSARRTVLGGFRSGAQERDYPFELTDEQAYWLFEQDCHYCGCRPSQFKKSASRANGSFVYNGIDRVDNNRGYLPDNVVACCGTCNRRKLTKTVDEFYDWVASVCRHSAKWRALPSYEPVPARWNAVLASGPPAGLLEGYESRTYYRGDHRLPLLSKGMQLGKLRVICVAGEETTSVSRTFYRCSCVCGKETIVQHHSLTTGMVKSCGCLRRGGGRQARPELQELREHLLQAA